MPNRVSSEQSALSVYKASAGSGKTHRLTSEYLSLLFRSPFAYKHILAVTFTNKATDEMKTRIVKELANLALGEGSDYLTRLCQENNFSEEQVRAKAKETLTYILHDYSAFSVSTIDRFFQQTMRAFTREIGLGGGYNVELDADKVLNEAIDSLLFDLEKNDNQDLLEWLIRFSSEKVEKGETWNIRADIQSLSREIFKESYKAFRTEVQTDISDKALMDDYKQMLFSYINTFQATSQQIGEKALNIMTRCDLTPTDFKGGGKSPFFAFLRWANGETKEPTATFRKLDGDVSGWYTKTGTDATTRAKIEDVYAQGLSQCVSDIIAHYDNMSMYQTAYEINRYFFTLGILGDIDKKIREYTTENNLMLISDTTELLNTIIQGSDTPFVYEKVGTRVDNYMIDEFQDTSRMQWENFYPLVSNSLASGEKNFIVGDVKQSIYRWRNSDWKLLDEQLDIDFANEGINHETLDTNWRSARNVVDFNNTIFSQGATLLQETYNSVLPADSSDQRIAAYSTRIEQAYNEVQQQVCSGKKGQAGHVRITFVDGATYDWKAHVLEQLPLTIEQLQDKGYSLKDIAILTRTKKEGADVANCLLQYKEQHPDSRYRYDIISDEALYINSSQSIKLIIALLKYLRNPLDESLKVLAVYEYYKYSNQLKAEDALQQYFSKQSELPEDVRRSLDHIRELPLYEMTEELSGLFRQAMDEDEQIYIQSFLDMVLDFTVRYSSDLDAFLNWWDETGSAKTIFTPDGQDAIRIMTIHKSKGLGFEVVLIPFCDWKIDHQLTTILWCHPQVAPFDRLHLVPVNYSQNLKNTIFKDEYFNERLYAFIDNFNILYVAFTRAKQELIAFAPEPKTDKVGSISSLLWKCINDTASLSFNLRDSVFELGQDYAPSLLGKGRDQGNEIQVDTLSSIPFDNRLQLLLNNKYFFTDTGARDYGTLMHEIVSKIQTIGEIEDIVETYYIAGSITSEQKADLISMLRQYLSDETVSQWYSGEYRVLNEVQILQPNGTFIRPDRVMLKGDEVVVIDYKFGEKEDRRHSRQVKHYVTQIRKMGYAEVKGYICYIKLGKVVEADLG
ncbi:exodeoxyribonuclease V subunit beta [Dysgonomonas sp. 25]|uniref:UvrD-helicase domain-containing protein n=1 Tax=Dysgonomonas sp. 25 TaxID=2302933 RepID=UPI0013D19C7F|nr:UvrD-helicase domain-containing protein [Dysgonomonas sp. 25]NDV68753.1 Dna2/Cas4 domain-containing protein [Dysgonomonas sp. 25]